MTDLDFFSPEDTAKRAHDALTLGHLNARKTRLRKLIAEREGCNNDCANCKDGVYAPSGRYVYFCKLLNLPMVNNSEGSTRDKAPCDLFIKKVVA